MAKGTIDFIEWQLLCVTPGGPSAEELLNFRIKPRDELLVGPPQLQYATEKLDGWRLTLVNPHHSHYGPHCNGPRAFTRTTDVTDVVMDSWFRQVLAKLPECSVLDCELTVPGRNASTVSALLAGNDPNGKGGLSRAEGCKLACFSVPMWKGGLRGRDGFQQQHRLVNDYFKKVCRGQLGRSLWYARWWKAWVETIEEYNYADPRLSKTHPLSKRRIVRRPMTQEEVGELLKDVLERDAQYLKQKGGEVGHHPIEGFVLKTGPFSGWVKYKPSRTIDLVCTGFEPGEGKYEGMVGAIKGSVVTKKGLGRITASDFAACHTDLREVASVSGMSDDVRSQIDIEKDVYRAFECEYQLVGDGGRLRHPRFLRWRDDKKPWECTFDQL